MTFGRAGAAPPGFPRPDKGHWSRGHVPAQPGAMPLMPARPLGAPVARGAVGAPGDTQVPQDGAGTGAERGGLQGWQQSQAPSAHLAPAWPVVCARGSAPVPCSVGWGAEAPGDLAVVAEVFGDCCRGWGRWAGPAPLWAQGSSPSLQEQVGGGCRGGLALCPPGLSQVSPAPCWQYCCAGEHTTAQFRHCRFLICLFIIQKLAHILMNP